MDGRWGHRWCHAGTPYGHHGRSGTDGLIKLRCDTDRDVLVGATSVATRGGEVLSTLTLAAHTRLPVTTLRQTIYAYPNIPPRSTRRCR